MDVKLVVDAIMRQTTVLIAQLSTSAGVRAPLAHLADQVFLELASEIEAQGVGRKVAADMFGLGLRSYQRKVRRLTESSTARSQSLWEAALGFITEQGATTREQVVAHFKQDSESNVGAVLSDLVGQGLVYATGRGSLTLYRASTESDRHRLARSRHTDALEAVVRLLVYRGARNAKEVAAHLALEEDAVQHALDTLEARGEVQQGDFGYTAETCLVPVGAAQGWEAAVLDHFRAVANAIAAKVRRGEPRSNARDVVGGATLTFEVSADHPLKNEVLELLSRMREQANELWQRVERTNQDQPLTEDDKLRVTFYMGQYLEDFEVEERQGN